MRPISLLALLLALSCKSNSAATSESTAQTSAASSPAAAPPAAGSPAADAPAGQTPTANPHAGLDPAAAARAESARAAGAEPKAASEHDALTARVIDPHTLTKLAQGRVGLGPFSLKLPADWQEKPSVSNMRAAEFQLPASGGQAEVVVYYFGESGAGSVQANIDRWVSQFTQPDGKPSSEVTKIEQASFAGQQASLVSVSGRYAARAMPGGQAVDKDNQSLFAAIVPSPKGPYYFRLIGDRAAVEAQTPKFRELLGSLQLQ
jgi:hypothetical protein